MKSFILKSLLIEITRNCDLKCKHCFLYGDLNNNKFLHLEKIIKIIDDAERIGGLEITFTGGEPTLHPHFYEIVKYAKEKGFAVSVLSNLYNLNKRSIEAFDKYVDSISVSIYGDSSDIHDGITDVKGSFQKIMNNIKLLQSKGKKITANVTFTKLNVIRPEKVLEFLKHNNLEASLNLRVFKNITGTPQEDLMLDSETLKDIIRYTGINTNDNIICNAGRNNIYVNTYGYVYPCIFFPYELGNLNNDSFYNIWINSPKIHTIRNLKMKDFDKCNKCSSKSTCSPCLGNNLMENNSITKPSCSNCNLGRLYKEVYKEQAI